MSLLESAKNILGGSDAAETRALTVQVKDVRVGVPVPRAVWWKAEVIREQFLQSGPTVEDAAPVDPDAEDNASAAAAAKEAQLSLLSQFLSFTAAQTTDAESAQVLLAAFTHFTRVHLSSTDVHSLSASLDADARRAVLSAFHSARAALEAQGVAPPTQPEPALLAAASKGEAEVYALFGGQGTNEVYFDELQSLYDAYKPYVADFLRKATHNVLVPLAAKATEDGFTYYAEGLDVLAWLNGERPPVPYLASIPLSLPLIGLTQLVQYLAFSRAAGLNPGELRARLAGATGHSQGVVSAVVASASASAESFTANALKGLKLLFYLGLRGQEAFPTLAIEPAIVADAVEGGEGTPSPMLSVTGLPLKALEKHLDGTNAHLPDGHKLAVSLFNGPRSFVVTGPPRALFGLVTSLRKVRAPTGLDQSKTPFSKRKAAFNMRFLVVGVPYHSRYLESATQKLVETDLKGEELFEAKDLSIAVYNTEDGSDLRQLSTSLTSSLASQIFTQPIHWTTATAFPDSATHAIDFGPGGLSGIGPLTARNWEGRGIRVLIPGAAGKTGAEVYSGTVRREDKWAEKWVPGLVKTKDGKIHIDTPFSRMLGKPPIMVAGMTPSTVRAGFVSAVLNAGFHIELAGGAHYNAAALRAKVAEIQAAVKPGDGITLNALYINQRQFTFQFPLWQELRREGLPIEGFCVAAGIPSSEKATEIISALEAAGIKHVAFKPGSVEGIRQVVNIAAANPGFPIILQWTGGRAGGHHSCEDFHQPILSTYASIRAHPNISLVAGSGFGGSDDVWPYLTGDWSVEQFGLQPMPFDGVLFASRVMVAKEAHTSEAVKQLIVAASGVDDAKWEGTYDRETGGILTVRSELGEPIHKIATRGVKLWREFDDTVFALPREKRAAWLEGKKDYVIKRLNADFQKPWFGEKADGTVVSDIGDMTYEEVARRMVRLMYVSAQSRWVDRSLRNLVGDWLRRVEERFSSVNGARETKYSILQSYSELDTPAPFLEAFFETYTDARAQLLASEDKAFFLNIAQRPAQKPVPFIPVLDASFEVWFKKDSLWQAEDIDAVFDQDPQRVCILQGPVAVKHSKVANEPVGEMLGNIESKLVEKLLERYYGGDESKIPTIDYLGSKPAAPEADLLERYGVISTLEAGKTTYTLGSSLPSVSAWLETLAGPKVDWLRALLTSPIVVRGKGYVSNPLKALLAPRKSQRVVVAASESGEPTVITVYGAIRSANATSPEFKAVEATFDAVTSRIELVIFEERRSEAVPLRFSFTYKPEMGYAPIHEQVEGRNNAIKDFYWRLWELGAGGPADLKIRDTFTGPEVTIQAADVERFCAVVGNDGEAFKTARAAGDKVQAPMDFAIVTGWQAIMKAIFPSQIDGDILKLVHLSNGFKLVDGARPLAVGDVCSAEAKIVSVTNNDSGKTVKVLGHVVRAGEPVIEVTSAFLFRGAYTDYENTFEIIDEDEYIVTPSSPAEIAVLQSKEWFHWDDDSKPLEVGTQLVFKVQSELHYKDKTTFSSISVLGSACVRNQLKELVQVATVELESGPAHGNPVLEYLRRHGKAQTGVVPFENGGYSLTSSAAPSTFVSPHSNEPYSKISGDFNPIHVNPYFADYAALPGTITHGLWSSAATRKFLETVAAENHPERVLSYAVTFVGMVLPTDELEVKLKHTGMKDGNKLIKVETFNQRGEKVIDGTAEVAQPTTAYVFTGQGSQEQGMGMELYANSPAAAAVWDAADAHLLDVYGFSIIDIVKSNAKTKTIHFGGLKGQAIRQRYMDLMYDTTDKDGNVKTLPLFPDIGLRTTDYTFDSPNGLLFATQFAQIALVTMEKAAFEDMRSKGLVQRDCSFAGHSLGEYASLASIADVLPISALTDVVFYRGLTMQRAVERDADGRSQFRMMAVNPSRIGKSFNEVVLREIVDAVSRKTDLLLQIVNFNVDGQQYVTAGHLLALDTLTNTLNLLKVQKIDIAELTKIMSVEQVKEKLEEIVEGCFAAAKEKEAKTGWIELERGFATIPLPGIDVPFHSRYLWAGVMPFRTYLSKKINPNDLDPDMLIGKYIPNLVAKPFEVSKSYAQLIFDQTASPRLDRVLKNWERDSWDASENRQKLAYTILVELLAYQFASPVRWIETQDLLFTKYQFERLVELGPSPTLTGMATRTQKLKYESLDGSLTIRRAILCHAKNTKELYYQIEDAEEESAPAAAESAPVPAAAPAAPAASAPVAAAPAASSGPAAEVPDEPLKAVDTLRIIIAQKLKKRVDEVPLSKAIKDLVGGKSTLQNEILGDLQAEFSSAPEKGEELPLDELGAALSVGYSGALGKHTSGLVSRLVGGKMPGGFNLSAIKAYLSKNWGLGPGRSDAALLLGVTMEPPKRLGSEPEAKAWLDSVVAAYAQQTGISLSAGGAAGGGGGGGGGGGAVISSEELEKFQEAQNEFASQQVDLYLRYLKRDARAGHRLHDEEKANSAALQERLDAIAKEHGDTYIEGVMPVFEPLKARTFDSSWNWARQDALSMFYDIIFGRLTTVDRDITSRCLNIISRADPALVDYMEYYISTVNVELGPTYKLAKELGEQLLENVREAVASGEPPKYKDVTFPTAPKTEVTARGDLEYSEVNRESVRKLEAYVKEMATGGKITGASVNLDKVQADVAKLWRLIKAQPNVSRGHKAAIKSLYGEVVRSLGRPAELRRSAPGPRSRRSSSQFLRPTVAESALVAEDKLPFLHLKRKLGNNWQYSSKLTSIYLDILTEIATSGTTFRQKNALLTGVGKGSIGVEILKGLLAGGARVVITTSRYSRATVEYYQAVYQECGSRDSSLTVVPFNQGSKQDVEALVEYIYSTLGMDLDYILPFAALPENGREIDGIDDKSELAHRIMLVNLLRLLGAVKTKKAARNFVTRPTQVVLPLSPNHGLFGSDGLYSESKISLETLFNRWSAESWGEYLCLAGAVIGWTRGTGLMSAINIVAEGVEKCGVRTFSAKEMAFNILGLMHPLLFDITQVEPIWADLNGGMDRLPNLAEITTNLRLDINATAAQRRAITIDNSADFKVVNGVDAERLHQKVPIAPRANFKFSFPDLKQPAAFGELSKLRGMIDLDKVVVVTGFAEVGPWGSSRTRWEMEARGEFTIEGCIEMAWMMGLIKHFDGRLKNGQLFVGWVDAKTQDPVDDKDVKIKYEKQILEHTGIRLIEPDLFKGYDPKHKVFHQEVELNHDLEAIEVSEADALKFKKEHGGKVDIWSTESAWFAKLKKGARVLVPKAFRFDRLVAGQIPTGWDAGRYGIPADIIAQTDRTALWALVCAAEALIQSGVNDPYELYKFVHPSEVGSSIGSGMGGMQSLAAMFKDRREEKDVQMDVLQETFINTVAGWVNLLLLSSSGPIKIPVGACATALQSVEIACDTILNGKAKVMLAGGFDDFSEEGSYEFANMKATSNTESELAMGREPNEMSRPTTTTRAGFMESQGTGVHVLMSASTAIKMGATIRGIVAFTSTSTDKAGRSVPAPGKGVLSTAREIPSKYPLPTLDIDYRARQLAFRRKQVSQWMDNEYEVLKAEVNALKAEGKTVDEAFFQERTSYIEEEARRQEKEALATFGMLEGSDPRIAPLRRALAVWGLTIDDVGAVSFHGTSTKANDKNESTVYNAQFAQLGRSKGNACPVIAQKWLTGHPKGGAAAWMFNGLTQVINDAIIPGNRNADNISAEMQAFEYLVYLSRSIKVDAIKCGILTSFGFGQVGGSALIIHPAYLLASLEPAVLEKYAADRAARYNASYKKLNDHLIKENLVVIKEAPPFTPELEQPVLLNPLARTVKDASGSYSFPKKLNQTVDLCSGNAAIAQQLVGSTEGVLGVGTDVELIHAVPTENETFLARNYTPAELGYARSQPDSRATLAGRWCAKEAIAKALGVPLRGAGAAMSSIEILTEKNGPKVHLHAEAAQAAASRGITEVLVSISHSDDVAVAFAQAL